MAVTARSGLVLCGAGLVVGLGLALGGSRLLESFLYEIPTTDPATYLLVALAVGVVSAAAGWIPARRAARVDPMTVLKSE